MRFPDDVPVDEEAHQRAEPAEAGDDWENLDCCQYGCSRIDMSVKGREERRTQYDTPHMMAVAVLVFVKLKLKVKLKCRSVTRCEEWK